MSEQLALLPGYALAHLQLTLVALLLGTAVSVPLGIWISRRPAHETAVVGLASVIQTIPGLALLAVMVPALAGLGALTEAAFGLTIRGIGYTPAVVALTLYSILPVLRNTLIGITEVDPALIEAARGVGMTDRQQLRQVELPLALPVIAAGIRTSAVWVVGTATLSTPVGATSLGNFIFSGLQTRNHTAVLVGSVAAAALALLLDGLIRSLESGMRTGSRARLTTGLAGLGALGLVALAGLAIGPGRDADTVVIGSKAFTEQYVLAELLAQQIAVETGLASSPLPSLGSTVAFDALRAGDIDLYVDYSGTIWATIMKREELPEDRAAVLFEVERFLADQHGIVLVAALGFENTYALGMREAQAAKLGITRISELARHAGDLELGADYEFLQRGEWRSLERAYGLAFGAQRSMDPALMYQAVAEGEVDVISAFSTDGRIAAFTLRLLDDDRDVIPPYDAIVLASPRLAREQPEVLEALAALGGRIDAAAMRRMNLAVDRDGRSPAEVAREFIEGLGR